MDRIKFQIVTPERTVLSEEVDSVSCPTKMGIITILPKHVPLIAALQPGELVAKVAGREQFIAISGGFVEVRPGNEVIILADTAEHSEEIDEARAEEAKKRAQELMKNAQKMSSEEYAALAASLEKSLARLRVARRNPHRGKHRVGSEGTFPQ